MSVITKKPAKAVAPVTVFVASIADAQRLERENEGCKAITSGIGTLKFHHLIAAHGAGEFETLFCPIEFKSQWKRPVGGVVKHL